MNQRRLGIFGGNFDPFHFGHLNSLLSVRERFGLDEVRVVPAAISPLRLPSQVSGVAERLEMLRRGVEGHGDFIRVDTREIERGGTSFTIETVESILAEAGGDAPPRLFLIVGMDQFRKFDQWKAFGRILEIADLVVTSRPGTELPFSLDDFPLEVRALVADYDSHQAMLRSGRTIYFMQLEDVDVSGTEVRRKIRFGQSVLTLIPSRVEEFVRERNLFAAGGRSIGDFGPFTAFAAKTLGDAGGVQVKEYDLRDRNAPSEYALVASGTSTRHASALAEQLVREVKREYGVWPENVEGQGEGRWVVVDYGSLIAHVFYDFVRQEYRLEDIWSRAPRPKP